VETNKINTANGTELVLNAGESVSYATGQTAENIYLNAEGGVRIISSPDNWVTGWAGRNELTLGLPNGTSSFPGDVIVNGTTLTGAPTGGEGISVSGNTVSVTNAYILGGVDLNTYRTTGFYCQNSNANAVSGSNYPEPLAGILEVYNRGLFTLQRYKIYNTASDYSRAYYNGSWTAWTDLSLSNVITNNNQLTNGAGYAQRTGLVSFTPTVKFFNGTTVTNGGVTAEYEKIGDTVNVYIKIIGISNGSALTPGLEVEIPSAISTDFNALLLTEVTTLGLETLRHGKILSTDTITISGDTAGVSEVIISGSYLRQYPV
jgi:hypothetical protein